MTPKEQIKRAESLITDATWLGHSGEPVTGEQAARFLEAALAAVEKSGWNPRSSGHSLWRAMLQLADSSFDADTQTVAENCLRLIVRARTGALMVFLMQWEERQGRTLDDVRDVVTAAAKLARKHGPTGGGR